MDKVIYSERIDIRDEKMINPYQYFQRVKSNIQTMDNEKLTKIYNNAMQLANEYNKTGQTKGLRKLIFYINSIIKEQTIIDLGITKFVFKSDIEDYIKNVASKQVVILDIANYERKIPNELIEKIIATKEIFDEFYIVCTDYNGTLSKQVQKERREKDPILFGAFLNREKQAINERFYYIGDWIDEYCDLTLDKMVAEMEEKENKNIVYDLEIPKTTEELSKQLDKLKLNETTIDVATTEITLITRDEDLKKANKSFFSKVKSFIKKDK